MLGASRFTAFEFRRLFPVTPALSYIYNVKTLHFPVESSISQGAGVTQQHLKRKMSDEIVTDDCIDSFHELLLKSKWQFIIFRFSDDQQSIIIDEKGSRGMSYDTFLTRLRKPEKANECRYAVFDAEYAANMEMTHIVFIGWIPEEAPEQQKTLYTSNMEILERSLVGVQVCVVCHHYDDLKYEKIVEKIQGK